MISAASSRACVCLSCARWASASLEVARGGVDAADVQVVADQAVAHQLFDVVRRGRGETRAAQPDHDAARAEQRAGRTASPRRCRCIRGRRSKPSLRYLAAPSRSAPAAGSWPPSSCTSLRAKCVLGSSRPNIVTGQPRATQASTAAKPIGPMPVTSTRGGLLGPDVFAQPRPLQQCALR